MFWRYYFIQLYIVLPLVSCGIVITNNELKSMVSKLQREVASLKRLQTQPLGFCSPTKCKQCQCIEDTSIPEKHYCDCRRLPAKRDCKQFYLTGHYTKGIYTVTMNGLKKTNVFCDGLGWTVIQRRIDGSTNFYRSWNEYKHGFGKLQREFWLGNQNIYALSTQALFPLGSELVVNMKSRKSWNIQYEAFYKHFQIDSEAANYKLHVKYSHGHGDSLSYHDNMEFSTFDRDHDTHKVRNCARELHGAWWYKSCARSNLNGAYDSYERGQPAQRIDWESLLSYRTQTWVEMKVMRLG